MTPSPADLDPALMTARERFVNTPPSIHGRYEYRSERETISYELWVDWPAFRLSLTATENDAPPPEETFPPFVIASLEGKRFGVRDPLSEEPYVTRSFGEAPWLLGPILTFFDDSFPSCFGEEEAIGIERVLDRSAIRVHCSDHEAFDSWIDQETGLVLRQTMEAPSEREPGWSGFVEIEFDPVLDHSLFDPGSV